MSLKINSRNLNRKKRINLSNIDKFAEVVIKKLKIRSTELNIIFISNQKIRALNRRYLGIDRATDVISFPFSGPGVRGPGSGKVREPKFLGDIAISSDKAMQNAKEYNVSFKEEIARYVVHGILHLCGYDDVTSDKRQKMREKEDGLLQETRKYIQ